MKSLRRFLLCFALVVSAGSLARAETAEEAYTRKLDDRVSKIVVALKLDDKTVSERLHKAIVAQYRQLNDWHEANGKKLKELKKAAASSEAAKAESDSIKATLKTIHDNFLAELARDLSPEQIERVKDGMTAGKVDFTYRGYLIEYPDMNEEQKAKVLAFLKEAREEAMDAGSMDEKSDIFNRYKGKINNWLSKQGVESRKSAAKKDAATKGEKK